MNTPVVFKIVRDWLETNGYQALAGADGNPCGCRIDDLFACDGHGLFCHAAWMVPCKGEACPEIDDCWTGPTDQCITTNKPDSAA